MRIALSVPATNERGPLYMDQALAAIHQGNPRRLPLTLEFCRHRENVGLCCTFAAELRALVEGQFYAQYPDCHLDRLADSDSKPLADTVCWTAELHLERDLFPIRRYVQFEDALNRTTADPLTAILQTLARAESKQIQSAIRITIRPARGRRRRRAERCLHRLARPFFRSHHFLAHLYVRLALSPWRTGRSLGWLLGRLAHREEHGAAIDKLAVSSGRLHDREDDLQAAADKMGRLLFETHVSLSVRGPPEAEAQALEKLRGIAGAFGQFSFPRLASFRLSRIRKVKRWQRRGFASLLSTEEIATLFHLPTQTVRAETMRSVLSRAFEPPVTLPTPEQDCDIAVLGMATFRSRRQRFGIRADDRRRHVAILGKTGMGKSTLLHHLITSDIHAGRGACLIDPHGDLIEAVLPCIPANRTNDVVLFDAGDAGHPLSFNLLTYSDPAQRPLIASGILASFRKLYGTFWGPRLEHILRNALLALLEVPGATLLSVLRILSDARFRQNLVGRLSDPVVRSFWLHEFAAMPTKLQLEAIAPIQNKVGHFVSSPLLRNIVGQARSTLNLRSIMDEGRILLVNLSKGRMGDDASALLGSFLVTALQLAAMGRAAIPEAERRDYFLYVDEFQNYATDAFATILSKARKYRLNLIIANQYLAQLEEHTLAAVFGNIGTLIAFQVGAQDAEVVSSQLVGDLTPQDLMTLPRYAAYVRLLIDGQPSRPFSMQTLPPQGRRPDTHRAAAIRRYSRQRYARPLATVEQEIAAAFG